MKDNSSDCEPRKTTARGFTKAVYLTYDQIEAVLDELRAGVPIEEACRTAGTSCSQFNRRIDREPELRSQVEEAFAAGMPAKQEWLRYMIHKQIKAGNWKALQAEAMIHLPEYEVLRTQRFEHTVTHQDAQAQLIIDKLMAIEGLTPAERRALLDREIQQLEALLPEQHPVLELPAKSAA
jgi:hypothetical protein